MGYVNERKARTLAQCLSERSFSLDHCMIMLLSLDSNFRILLWLLPAVFVVGKVIAYYLTMMLRLVLRRYFVNIMLGSRLMMFIAK